MKPVANHTKLYAFPILPDLSYSNPIVPSAIAQNLLLALTSLLISPTDRSEINGALVPFRFLDVAQFARGEADFRLLQEVAIQGRVKRIDQALLAVDFPGIRAGCAFALLEDDQQRVEAVDDSLERPTKQLVLLCKCRIRKVIVHLEGIEL